MDLWVEVDVLWVVVEVFVDWVECVDDFFVEVMLRLDILFL